MGFPGFNKRKFGSISNGDWDRDGVKNMKDCDALNWKKQDGGEVMARPRFCPGCGDPFKSEYDRVAGECKECRRRYDEDIENMRGRL